MLYEISKSEGKFTHLDPLKFQNMAHFGNQEKDLENILASSMFQVLFEEARLFPIFQERSYQAEADIYALNESGDLVIFELKRESANVDAVQQILRYAQEAGQWRYPKLAQLYKKYEKDGSELSLAHKEAFELDEEVNSELFNRRQHLIIIGSAADVQLTNAVEYWKKHGISIDFMPYRIFDISGKPYFEFFAKPYDRHKNPGDAKGVLFDTNRSYDEESIWYMMENSCVAAFGDAKRFVEYVYPGDYVFFSHKYSGIVAVGKVKNGSIQSPDDSTLSRQVDFLTRIPKKGEPIKAISFKKVSEILERSFFWARTIKVPYLSVDESKLLLEEVKKTVG